MPVPRGRRARDNLTLGGGRDAEIGNRSSRGPGQDAAVFTPARTDQTALAVTLTAVGEYVVPLETTDKELTGMDLVTINAFIDSCEAARSSPDYEPFPGDFNGDYIVNDLDLAQLQKDSLKCHALDCTGDRL